MTSIAPSDSNERSIYSVFDLETVQNLGLDKPEELVRSKDPEEPLNAELRKSNNPDNASVTTSAQNLASSLTFDTDLDATSEELSEQAEEALREFRSFFADDTEFPVYASERVRSSLESEDELPVYVKLEGIDRVFSCELKGLDEMFAALDEVGAPDWYERDVRYNAQKNHLSVPVVTNSGGLPDNLTASVVYRPDDPIVMSPDNPLTVEGVDDFTEGSAGFSEHPHIDEWSNGEGYNLMIDCTGAGIEDPNVQVDGEELVVYDGATEVYRASPDEIDLDYVSSEDIEGRVNNGVYDLSI